MDKFINQSLDTPLILECKRKNFKKIIQLLNSGCNPNLMNKYYDSAASLYNIDKKFYSEKAYISGVNNPNNFFNPNKNFLNPDKNKIFIRCIQPADDNARICELYLNAYSEYMNLSEESDMVFEKWFTKVFTQDMKNIYEWYGKGYRQQTAFWVACINKEIIGTIAVVPVPYPESYNFETKTYEIAELRRLSISNKYQRMGIGKLLIDHSEQWCKKIGYKTISLETLPIMYKATSFYEKMGYEKILQSKVIKFSKSLNFDFNISKNIKKEPMVKYTKEFLINDIVTGKYPFPYKYTFTSFGTIQQYYMNLYNFDTSSYVKNHKFDMSYYNETDTLPLPSCNILNGENKIIQKLMSKNDLPSDICIFLNEKITEESTTITDYFNEIPRMQAIYKKDGVAPIELFRQRAIAEKIVEKSIRKFGKDFAKPYAVRRAIYGAFSGANLFKPVLAKTIYGLFSKYMDKNISVMDCSAGWGDRLIGAMSCKNVIRYLGFDPNLRLKNGYEKAIQAFSGVSTMYRNFEIQNIPFEDSFISETFDLVFTSPPFFDVEIYNTESETQSTARHSTFDSWLYGWLFPMIQKSWSVLNSNGYLALYINDDENDTICSPMLNYASTLPNNLWMGVFGVESQTRGKFRSLYVWKKY